VGSSSSFSLIDDPMTFDHTASDTLMESILPLIRAFLLGSTERLPAFPRPPRTIAGADTD
jgi:hypothetical protein